MTADLAAWLLADDGPIAADERIARAATPGGWWVSVRDPGPPPWAITSEDRGYGTPCPAVPVYNDAVHIALHQPSRVLAECAAKRAVVKTCLDATPAGDMDELDVGLSPEDYLAKQVVRTLAQPYRGRPGWRAEWQVSS